MGHGEMGPARAVTEIDLTGERVELPGSVGTDPMDESLAIDLTGESVVTGSVEIGSTDESAVTGSVEIDLTDESVENCSACSITIRKGDTRKTRFAFEQCGCES